MCAQGTVLRLRDGCLRMPAQRRDHLLLMHANEKNRFF